MPIDNHDYLPPPLRVRALGDFQGRGGLLYGPIRMHRGETRVLYGWLAAHLIATGFVEPVPGGCPPAPRSTGAPTPLDALLDHLIARGLLFKATMPKCQRR